MTNCCMMMIVAAFDSVCHGGGLFTTSVRYHCSNDSWRIVVKEYRINMSTEFDTNGSGAWASENETCNNSASLQQTDIDIDKRQFHVISNGTTKLSQQAMTSRPSTQTHHRSMHPSQPPPSSSRRTTYLTSPIPPLHLPRPHRSTDTSSSPVNIIPGSSSPSPTRHYNAFTARREHNRQMNIHNSVSSRHRAAVNPKHALSIRQTTTDASAKNDWDTYQMHEREQKWDPITTDISTMNEHRHRAQQTFFSKERHLRKRTTPSIPLKTLLNPRILCDVRDPAWNSRTASTARPTWIGTDTFDPSARNECRITSKRRYFDQQQLQHQLLLSSSSSVKSSSPSRSRSPRTSHRNGRTNNNNMQRNGHAIENGDGCMSHDDDADMLLDSLLSDRDQHQSHHRPSPVGHLTDDEKDQLLERLMARPNLSPTRRKRTDDKPRVPHLPIKHEYEQRNNDDGWDDGRFRFDVVLGLQKRNYFPSPHVPRRIQPELMYGNSTHSTIRRYRQPHSSSSTSSSVPSTSSSSSPASSRRLIILHHPPSVSSPSPQFAQQGNNRTLLPSLPHTAR